MKQRITLFWTVLLGLLLMLGPAAVWAQTPAEAVADVVANSGVFPAGTSVVGVSVGDNSIVVELSPEAAPMGLGDEQADAMGKAVRDALEAWPELTATEITVAGVPLWQYLPRPAGSDSPEGGGIGASSVGASSVGASSVGGPIGISSIGGGGGAGSGLPALTGELAGKGVGLYPSHGMYWHQGYNRWFVSQRTLCGPNPSPPRPPGWDSLWQSVYHPSNYYYWTRNFQWGSFYEDYRTPQEIRFLRAYCESSGANVLVGRNLDKEAGDFPLDQYPQYPNCSYPIPKWATAAKYHLEDIGAPEAVWNEPALTAQTDKDIRARPYWTNYHMVEPIFGVKKWPLTSAEIQTVKNTPEIWQNWVSIHLHTNAAGAVQAQARGTETYWYTATYPWLQAKATQLAGAFEAGMINAIRNQYDGFWADAQYDATMAPVPVEWITSYGTYRGYRHAGTTLNRWQDRGVKTSNFGEIREAMVPAVLTELLFHDDWKFYPDHVFAMDQVFQASVAWGMYEGICNYWGITPKPRMAASVDSVSFPTLVGPSAAISGSVTMKNEGMVWCWGNKTSTAVWPLSIYFPYTVWKLQATANDQFVPGAKLEIDPAAVIYPSEMATFNISLTGPATTGLYTTEWQMLKDDAFGSAFGDVVTAQIQVDADPPVITITSPAEADYPYGGIAVEFSATDTLSEVVSITADVDGAPVSSGVTVYGLALGPHTLTVTAVDTFGNTGTASVTFNVVNTVGKTTAGGWIELVGKKATCGFVSEFVEGAAAPAGNVTYQDHDTGMTVKSIALVAMGIVGNQAWIHGTCEIEGQPGHSFRIHVIDNGEPGDTDVFEFDLETGYHVGGTLGGGNIVIH